MGTPIPEAGFFDRVIAGSQSAAATLRVRSALNPMLWLCAIISIPCFAGAWFAHGIEPLATILAYVGAAPVAASILMAIFFAIFRPEKLQSEEYQLRHEALALIKEKGSPIELSPSSLEVIANPAVKALPGRRP